MPVTPRRVWRAAPGTLVVVAIFVLAAGAGVPFLAYLIYRRDHELLIPGFLLALTVLGLFYAWRFGLHPRLRATDDGVTVVNPFRKQSFEWDDIRVVAPGENGLVIASEDARAEAWCIQKSNFAAKRGRVTRCDRVADELIDIVETYDPPLADAGADLRIRRARPDESRRLMRIERAASEQEFGHIFPPEEYAYPAVEVTRRWRRLLHDPAARVFVLELSEAPVGFVAFNASTVMHLAVMPHQMRHGYGSALLQYATQDIFDSGGREAQLWVLVENEVARSFYRSHRWTETEQRRDCDFPPFPKEMRMSRPNPAAPRRSR